MNQTIADLLQRARTIAGREGEVSELRAYIADVFLPSLDQTDVKVNGNGHIVTLDDLLRNALTEEELRRRMASARPTTPP